MVRRARIGPTTAAHNSRSTLAQINTSNVKNLAPAWIFQTGEYTDEAREIFK
jgi:glucose dehydrogenase